jgi:hypothetical protein
MVKRRAATMQDIIYMSQHMRPEDIQECKLMTNLSPFESLKVGYADAKYCFVGEDSSGKLVCLGGISSEYQIWMLFPDDINSISPTFIKESIKMIRIAMKQYHYLYGYTMAENQFILKYVKLLGFSIQGPEKINGKIIRRYVMDRR